MKTLKISEVAHLGLQQEKVELQRAGCKYLKTLSDVIEFYYFAMHSYWNTEEELINKWNENNKAYYNN